jgi:GLPGLI family protein
LTYYAWYTDEIPIQDGPFLFVGLPGFIVELGVDDMFFIKFTNYEYNENQITIIDNIKD